MKILHASDLHFGISLCGVPLIAYQQLFCDAFCRLAEKADAVIISGDIFDTSVANAEAIRCWSSLVTKLCTERKIPVIVCAGNHDGAARLASCSELLKASDLYIFGTLDDAFTPVIIGDVSIYSLPHFNPSDGAVLLGCKPTSAAVMEAAVKKILSEADKSGKLILSAHCFAAGATASESDISARAAESVGGIEKIPLSAFDGFDYVALGHLHKAQTLSKSGAKTIIRYSGTPLPYSFGEAMQKKTVTIYDTELGEITEIEIPSPYTLRTLTGSFDDLMKEAQDDPNRDAFMKISVTDRYAGDNMFMKFKDLYPNLLHFTGKQSGNTVCTSEVSAKDAAELDIISLAARYSEEHRGSKPDEDELKWLSEALAELEKEE